MPLRKLIESANHAVSGIIHTAKTQKHMRYHLYAALLIIILSLVFGVGLFEFMVIVILVSIVLSAEMFNTAIEAVIDVLFKEYDSKAKAIKDIAAGAVFITAIGAAIVGYMILLSPFRSGFYEGLTIAKHSGEGIAFTSLVIVLILVVITKAFFGRGTPLRGGVPSGHAAIAFSIWTTVTLLSGSFILSFLVLIMAILIAQSRVSIGVHNPWEVILGALFGSVVTFFLFKLFLP
ncbi:MAG: diacylglycerol kinase [Nitrospirae bacterium]|nr:diacylglycerol kinase [Nitrospirota bacterium]